MRKLSYFCLIASTLLAGCGKDDVVKPEPEPVVRIENRSYSPEDVYLETTYYSHGSWTEQVEMKDILLLQLMILTWRQCRESPLMINFRDCHS